MTILNHEGFKVGIKIFIYDRYIRQTSGSDVQNNFNCPSWFAFIVFELFERGFVLLDSLFCFSFVSEIVGWALFLQGAIGVPLPSSRIAR